MLSENEALAWYCEFVKQAQQVHKSQQADAVFNKISGTKVYTT